MKEFAFNILGVGAWGSTFQNWEELHAIFLGGQETEHELKGPKPEIIPANERRRAPLPVRLAVETSWQATQQSQLDPKDLASVFVSGIGDTQLTDYMCKVLASENKALSPTKFHNSVHNAAAGYWTISTGCMQSANSVAGFQQSVSLSLLEALIQSTIENKPLLLSFYDAPCSEVLHELLHNDQSFAASLVIAPKHFNADSALGAFTASIEQARNDDAATPAENFSATAKLEHLYSVNPAAQILPLLSLLASGEKSAENSYRLPLSSATQLSINAV